MLNGRAPAPKEDKEALLELVKRGLSFRAACSQLGYDKSAGLITHWKNADPEFASRLEEARQIGIGALEDKVTGVIFDDSIEWNGAKSNLAMFVIKQRDPSYRESAPPVQFNLNVEHKSIDMAEVAKVLNDAGAMEIIEGEATEIDDSQRAIPGTSEVRTARSGE